MPSRRRGLVRAKAIYMGTDRLHTLGCRAEGEGSFERKRFTLLLILPYTSHQHTRAHTQKGPSNGYNCPGQGRQDNCNTHTRPHTCTDTLHPPGSEPKARLVRAKAIYTPCHFVLNSTRLYGASRSLLLQVPVPCPHSFRVGMSP